MEFHERYQIIETIGSGDFATVYRARDLQLGREVAVKQIHQQFLAEPAKLERFWDEAQLLASLEHPGVMTIYDLSRPHGCLVLELMQGNLKQLTAGRPLNLDYLRVALFHCLHALRHLHSAGIVHGDIKPGNLMIDKRNRIKIGDFGLARRVADDEGSLIRGTTKYMAPEVFSDEYGPVTGASDLYSLGFSAYELLCGEQFENLFPGLGAFGRDRQLAWIMWHAAADRRLPEIGQVMEGVPADLAHTIQRLTIKDPRQRYRTADEAINDLVHDPQMVADSRAAEEAEARRLAEEQAKKKKRTLAIAALACSLMLSLGILLFSGGEPPQEPKGFEPQRGVIGHVIVDGGRKLIVNLGGDRQPLEVAIRSDDDIRLNHKSVSLRDLLPGDRVAIDQQVRDGRKTWIVDASRPTSSRGRLEGLEADEGRLTLSIEAGPDQGVDLPVAVPPSAEITLNDRPAKLGDLKAGDAVEVTHVEEAAGRVATGVSAVRAVTIASGVVRGVMPEKKEVTFSPGDSADVVALPYTENCDVTLNGLRFLDGAPLKPRDLKPGDRIVQMVRDTHVRRLDAYRTFDLEGTLLSVRPELGTIDLGLGEEGETLSVRVGKECPIRLGEESVDLGELHRRDRLRIMHDDPDRKSVEALEIVATRPVDKTRWALVIGVQEYDDRTLTPPATAATDARSLAETLRKRYAVSPDQLVLLMDPSRIRIEQEVPDLVEKAGSASQLFVYFAGHAFVDEDEGVYLAPRDFALARAASSGLRLDWLFGQLESCGAREKLLLLDACREVSEELAPRQPSTAEMVQLYKRLAPQPALKSVTVVASCSAGQRSIPLESGQGLFSATLSEGLTGAADDNADNRVTASELFEFARGRMGGTLGPENTIQLPEIFLPDDTPPRLTEEAKEAIRRQLALLSGTRLDVEEAASLYQAAEELAAGEPEPKLAFGLALLKDRRTNDALRPLEDARLESPQALLAHQGVAYIQFLKRKHVTGLSVLADMIAAIPKPKRAPESYSEYELGLFDFAGRLREYAAGMGLQRPDAYEKLDAAVAEHSQACQDRYAEGRQATQETHADFDRRIASAEDDAQRTQLRLERKQLPAYAEFSVEGAARRILDRLEGP